MVKTPVFPHELIGEKVTIVKASNKSLEGMVGKIIDETKFTLTIEQGGKVKRVLKNGITLKLSGQTIIVGKTIMKRPEERIKGK